VAFSCAVNGHKFPKVVARGGARARSAVLLNSFDAWCNIDAVATVGNRVAASSAGWGAV